MAKVFDTEDLFNKVIAFVKAKINTKIGDIRTEKGIDAADWKDVATQDDAFVFLTMNETTVNRDVWVFITQNPPTTAGIGPTSAKKEFISISIIFSYQNNSISGFNALRYRRALREIFEDGWDKIMPFGKIKISDDEIFPVFEGDPSDDEAKMTLVSLGAGVTIEVNWAT